MKIHALCASIVLASFSLSACQNTTPINPNQVLSPSSANIQSTQTTPELNENSATEISHVTTSDLSQYQWTLVSAVDSSNMRLVPLNAVKDQVLLNFGQLKGMNILRYSLGCNTMTGRLQLVDSVMTIEEGVSTKKFCAELDEAEKLLNRAMHGDSQLSIKRGAVPILTQLADDNTILVWQGKQSTEAKHGQAEMIFWAVDHEVVPCPDGTTKECLKVKPIQYDINGVKMGEGEWTLFDGEIEGFTHDRDHNQVIRLKRYTDEDKNSIYVLDTVVESILVK